LTHSSTPFFTIITATYNAGGTLQRLLNSLVVQTCRDFEFIIQDGASCDGTLEIVKSYAQELPFISLVSAPDRGIFDAWNKAVKRIRGEWVIFLGADDVILSETTLADVREVLLRQLATVVFGAGDIIICDDDKELFTMTGLNKDVAGQMRAGEPAVHSGLFQRACLFAATPFDATFKIVGDYDFVTRLWKKDSDGVHLGMIVTRMYVGGATSNLHTLLRYRYEKIRVLRRYFGLSATLPHLLGLLKGLIPFILSRLFSPENAVSMYKRLRTLRNLPCAHIK
jgi:glycosyltransferase involved in cell wall biosynthesis